MMAELKLSEIEWGWVMGAFPLGYALLQIPGGILGQHFGPRRLLCWIAIAWSVLIALTALLPSPTAVGASVVISLLIAIQFLVGVSHAPIFPVSAVTIERWFPRGAWSLPNGLNSSALTIGLALTASLLPWMVDRWDWRDAFWLLAPSGVLMAAVWFWLARDRPHEHPRVSANELALIGARAEQDPRQSLGASWTILRNRDVLFTTLSYSCHNFVYYIVFSWGFYYLVNQRGFAEQEAGFLTSAQWLGAGIGAAFGGWLGDFACRRMGMVWGSRWPVMIAELSSSLLLLGVAWIPEPMIAAVLLGLCFFCNQIAEGPYWGCITAIGGSHAGAASGVMNTGGNLMGFVNAILLAMLAQAVGWAWALSLGAVFALVAAALMLLVRAERVMGEHSSQGF
jgi:ACS family glucarate transporter-like MFS transporter